MTIYGLNALEAREQVGDLGQVVRIHRLVSEEGPARGARMLRMVSRGLLEVEIPVDRAADGWVRTRGGGLLSAVGLDSLWVARTSR